MYVRLNSELKIVREKMGISRRVLADRCKISEKTIQRVENGEKIRLDIAQDLAKELNIDLNSILLRTGLTNAQNEIINDSSNIVQIIAGPGSGKTKVLVKKVIALLENGCKPKNIVVFTFTEKAADELNHRIKIELRDSKVDTESISDMYIGTIHGFCLHILQDILGVYKDFKILTPVRSRIFVDKNFYEIGINNITKIKDKEPMSRYIHTTKFLSIVSLLEENKVIEEWVPKEINEAKEKYKSLLIQHRFFDFTSIMVNAYNEVLNNNFIREYVYQNIKYLLVDEYQDVNLLQERLINELYSLGVKLLVVGDLDQSIYSWRGSDVNNFIDFESRYNGVKKMYLKENFRSTEGIIDIANKSISNNFERISDITITSVNKNYHDGDILYNQFEDPEVEAEFIADRIIDLNKKLEVPLKEIAVLLRTNKLSDKIVEELDRRKIPYIVEGVNKLFETPEVKASVNIIKYVCKEISAIELEQSWKCVYPDIKISKIREVINYLNKIDISKSKLYNSSIIQNIFLESISIMDIIVEEGVENNVVEKIYYNIGKFSQVIDDYESINFKVIPEKRFKEFCKFISLTAPEYYPEGYLENPYIKVDGIRIMTIHQSKGLEFTAVLVPGLSNNLFPHQKVGGLSVWHYLPEKAIEGHERYTKKDIESERRLFFVAITRSKRFLILSRAKYGRNTGKISPFLTEIKKSYKIIQYTDNKVYENLPKFNNNTVQNDGLMVLSFSTLTDYKECPYKFKISNLYGFRQIIRPQNGYGNIMHNIANDLNKEMLIRNNLDNIDIGELIEDNFYLPYLDSGQLYNNLKNKCIKSARKYKSELSEDKEAIIEYVEQNIEVPISDSIILKGRMDLVKKIEETSKEEKVFIVDFKTESEHLKNAISSNSEENEKLSLINDSRKMQLLIYAMGYKNLTGKSADFIEVYNLDNNNRDREMIKFHNMVNLTSEIELAAQNISNNNISKKCSKEKCSKCFVAKLCTSKEERDKYNISIIEN